MLQSFLIPAGSIDQSVVPGRIRQALEDIPGSARPTPGPRTRTPDPQQPEETKVAVSTIVSGAGNILQRMKNALKLANDASNSEQLTQEFTAIADTIKAMTNPDVLKTDAKYLEQQVAASALSQLLLGYAMAAGNAGAADAYHKQSEITKELGFLRNQIIYNPESYIANKTITIKSAMAPYLGALAESLQAWSYLPANMAVAFGQVVAAEKSAGAAIQAEVIRSQAMKYAADIQAHLTHLSSLAETLSKTQATGKAYDALVKAYEESFGQLPKLSERGRR